MRCAWTGTVCRLTLVAAAVACWMAGHFALAADAPGKSPVAIRLVAPGNEASPAARSNNQTSKSAPALEQPSGAAKSAAKDKDKEDSLQPIPDAENAGPVELEPASFRGVSPGTTSVEDMQKAWGEPQQSKNVDGSMHYLYSVPPFDRIEAVSFQGKVISVVIQFDKSFPAASVAKQLDLTKVRPVLISNEMGEILGQSYPERGVVLAFEPGDTPSKPSMKVSQIVLESISAEPFVLRAETLIDHQPKFSLSDLDQALKLQPKSARAHWLRGRVLAAMSDLERAQADAADAVRLEPKNAQFRVTRAQILGQAGHFGEAIQEAERAATDADSRPHVKARALCLLGDLHASSPSPVYKEAMAKHSEAIKVADGLLEDTHPAIRQAAKEVLIDAHLGAAHDIAWGTWKEKERAINRWLERAKTLADDLVKSEGGSEAYRFHVCSRALAACVGARGLVDPAPWTEEALKVGRGLLKSTDDPIRKAQFQWDLGMALYDSLQVYQIRGDHDTAMKYGEMAIEYLEQNPDHQSPAAQYLLGRLYFRMGAVYALRDQNHRAALTWFDKAMPLLDKSLPMEAQADLGRHGETFISMGVSYWESGQHEKGLRLTQHGVTLMEQAVKQGILNEPALAVAYGNMAVMHRAMGQTDPAERFETMASRAKKTVQK